MGLVLNLVDKVYEYEDPDIGVCLGTRIRSLTALPRGSIPDTLRHAPSRVSQGFASDGFRTIAG